MFILPLSHIFTAQGHFKRGSLTKAEVNDVTKSNIIVAVSPCPARTGACSVTHKPQNQNRVILHNTGHMAEHVAQALVDTRHYFNATDHNREKEQ